MIEEAMVKRCHKEKVEAVLVHYCTLSLSDIWVTRQIINTNSQWSIQRLSRWVTNYISTGLAYKSVLRFPNHYFISQLGNLTYICNSNSDTGGNMLQLLITSITLTSHLQY